MKESRNKTVCTISQHCTSNLMVAEHKRTCRHMLISCSDHPNIYLQTIPKLEPSSIQSSATLLVSNYYSRTLNFSQPEPFRWNLANQHFSQVTVTTFCGFIVFRLFTTAILYKQSHHQSLQKFLTKKIAVTKSISENSMLNTFYYGYNLLFWFSTMSKNTKHQ